MSLSLHFAHITDVHISDNDRTWGTLGALSDHLLAVTIAQLNALDDLDFVIITGDVLDMATSPELERFTGLMRSLHRPWHFIPGNHDGYYHPEHPEAFAPHEAVPVIDPRMAEPVPHAQKAHWSRPVAEGARLIGLDSRKADSWGGEINGAQMAWLFDELEAHRRETIIVAVHHPLHNLTPKNMEPWWSNFICDNARQVEMLLDAYPNVRMVLSGHHHANQMRRRGGRLHISTAALSGYPCTYRTIRLEQVDGGWHAQVRTHTPADEATLKAACDLLLESDIARRFNRDDPEAWAEFAAGGSEDRAFEGLLA